MALFNILIHYVWPLGKNVLNEATGGDHHVIAMSKIDNFLEGILGHKRKGSSRELQGVYVLTHGLQDILQVPNCCCNGLAQLSISVGRCEVLKLFHGLFPGQWSGVKTLVVSLLDAEG